MAMQELGLEPFEFACACCGMLNTARMGRYGAWLIKCWRGCEPAAMADALGCAEWELLENAPRFLRGLASSTRRDPEPLPSVEDIAAGGLR